MALFDSVRFPLRVAGFVGLTFGMYGLLEAENIFTEDKERERLVARWTGRYGRGLNRLFGVELKTEGDYLSEGKFYPGRDEHGLGRIFVVNHRSGLDVMVCLAHFEATFVSRADLAGWPIIGLAAKRVGTLFVDRTSKRSGAAVISAMCQHVEQGRGVILFPEGTTFEGDEVRSFHHGAFTTAVATGASIVPAGLTYSGNHITFGDESFTSHMSRVASHSVTRGALVVGKPLYPKIEANNDRDLLRDLTHARVQTLVERARAISGP
jgi:1-acyl-sn-glycerol-3-phosphate acyltransferase